MQANLPLDMLATGLDDRVSWDGQIYLRCDQCEREARIHYRWVTDLASFPEAVCTGCGAKLETFARHLLHEVYRCHDCDHHFDLDTSKFEDPSCPVCGSYSIETLESELFFPFPATFDQIAPPKRQQWGVVLQDDLEQLQYELRQAVSSADFAGHLLLGVRFCRRLSIANDYPLDTIGIALPNLEANLLLEHCKQTSSLETGIRALELFEELGTRSVGDPGYIIAHASHILLVRFSEVELASVGHPTLRADAIRHARTALELAKEEVGTRADGSLAVAQIEVLLSSLLSVGDAGVEEKTEAITVADRALGRNVLSPEGADDLRVNRAIAIVETPNVGEDRLDGAISDLEECSARLAREEGSGPRLLQILFNLGKLYYERRKLPDAIRSWEKSAELAREELVQAGDANRLADKGGQYLFIFETLASALAESGRAAEALAAYETLRGAVPRLAGNESLRAATAVRAVMHLLEGIASRENPDREREPVSFLSPDVSKELESIRGSLLVPGTVLVYFGWTGDLLTALLIHSGPDQQICIDPVQWPFLKFPTRAIEEAVLRALNNDELDPRVRVPALFNAATFGEPGPLRNKRLTIASKDAYRYLFAPVQARLQALGTNRLAICTAGLLGSISFETISDPERPGWFLANDFQVCYLPSLGVASNIAASGPRGGASLLMIGYTGTDLPGVEIEIEAIRAAWRGDHKVLHGAALNKRMALEELAKGYDFIHFAGHGTFDDEESLMSAFYFASKGGQGADDAYRLTAQDLLTIRLPKHPVVTLSACSTGVTATGEAHRFAGLPGSLLQIGACAVIGSRWPVGDDVALDVMRHTYGNIASGAAPFDAFMQAQERMRATRAIEDWGAFRYIGIP
jgi:tetratricopeptide (TPR) repeat protein